MSSANETNDNSTDNKNSGKVRQLAYSLLANGVVYDELQFDDALNTCLIFVNIKNLSAVDITPFEQAAREVHGEVQAVIDSSIDQLCFFVVFKQ
jgi:hypothetical protein